MHDIVFIFRSMGGSDFSQCFFRTMPKAVDCLKRRSEIHAALQNPVIKIGDPQLFCQLAAQAFNIGFGQRLNPIIVLKVGLAGKMDLPAGRFSGRAPTGTAENLDKQPPLFRRRHAD